MIDVKQLLHSKIPEKWHNTWLINAAAYALKKIIKQTEINQFLRESQHLKGFDFIDAILDYFQFSYQVSERDKSCLPSAGRCVIVANHPLGALDSLALLHWVCQVRPDVKILANDMLSTFDALSPYLLPVNNFKTRHAAGRMSAIHDALTEEMAVIIFPAGEVSRTRWTRIRDGAWHKGFYHFAKRANAPIVPVYIQGKNTFWFYLWAKINRQLAMILLPRQMWHQRKKVITLRVGSALPIDLLTQLPFNDKQIITMVRKHVYKLAKNSKGLFQLPDPVAHPERRKDLRLSINHCQTLGQDSNENTILLYEPQKNSPLLRELGRLREMTFRQVGEGSQKRRDLDHYDANYQHLIIWNDHDLEIMGAYRVFPTKNCLANATSNATSKTTNTTATRIDISALYTSSLFDFHGDLNWLANGLELGRSFVQPKYWGTRSLDNLWQGIGAYCAKHPDIRYLFGTVSISASYPSTAIDYLVAYYRHYYPRRQFDIQSKNPYRLSAESQQHFDRLFANQTRDAAYIHMKNHLREMHLVVPTLFKHYAALCEAKGVVFTDFGVDDRFNGCVDGFVIVDLHHIKPSKHKRYLAGYEEGYLAGYHEAHLRPQPSIMPLSTDITPTDITRQYEQIARD
ncbi:lysophospholipid acyltransferase family protein [Ostreibacterium oceani]|uniref:L-ornithine N(alpha)-acyltransferase n=1 Tax=Ostreibacterium oceani TaxID=2654998 RepID=A0A6N7ESJ0_9GAMM|nr:lysophospholipid acyltransferase family protein [Ostreibacterium oceani]MPV85511.1 GNAT family N-acetyltransferase [Ostreibacterium oceani]